MNKDILAILAINVRDAYGEWLEAYWNKQNTLAEIKAYRAAWNALLTAADHDLLAVETALKLAEESES